MKKYNKITKTVTKTKNEKENIKIKTEIILKTITIFVSRNK